VLRSKGFGAADNNEELVKIEAADITIASLSTRDKRTNGLITRNLKRSLL
jgi:hypothetical protein